MCWKGKDLEFALEPDEQFLDFALEQDEEFLIKSISVPHEVLTKQKTWISPLNQTSNSRSAAPQVWFNPNQIEFAEWNYRASFNFVID